LTFGGQVLDRLQRLSREFCRGGTLRRAVIGGILTAMVTPFDKDGELAEDVAVRLMHHLLEHGSDGLVLAGSTGEAATLTDDEKARLWELGAAESGDAPVIAGSGTYDTRHSVELTERAAEAGADAALVVTPYYVRPTREGIKRHFQEVASVGLPIIAYNIPIRTATDMPNDLLAELGQIENVVAVKQARHEDVALVDGLDLLAGDNDMLASVMDLGGTGGILVASQLVGAEMRRVIDEPDNRHEIERGLSDLYEALNITTNPIPIKAAMNLAGHEVGGLRLPMVEATEEEKAVLRAALERHELLAAV
jgi:4-hydroxy-tetrahydrodipicolinate synthase